MSDKKVGPVTSNVLETDLDGEVSIYDPVQEQVTILNGTATDVWYLCDGSMTVTQIIESLARSYKVDPDQIREDVIRTIQEIREAGLLGE